LKDGLWSARNIWKGRVIPTSGANVQIPAGRTVMVNDVNQTFLRTVRVDGILQFAPDRDTQLIVDTLVVTPTGKLIIGTRDHPIEPTRSARLLFADSGPIDTRWDPLLLSRGLISHGAVSLVGAPITPFLALSMPLRKGDTLLHLTQRPTNWKKGDFLIVSGTRIGKDQDEVRKILDIAGTVVTIAPLSHDHTMPYADLSVYVANVTRNVRLESQNTLDIGRRGHAMFMHSDSIVLLHCGFYDLGRTDKRKPIDDPHSNDETKLLAGTGTNPRGRYAVHFHRTGIDAQKPPILVYGCAVVNSPGWGYVNHSSDVNFENNVAYNVTGAAFVTEAGDEIGTFRHNIAIHSDGSGEEEDSRHKLQDFGHEGDGFWFQGGGVTVEENIAAGQAANGFIFFTQGLIQEGLGQTRFLTANLPDPSWADGSETVSVQTVPIRSFKRNIAYACEEGFKTRFHMGAKDGGPRFAGQSILEDSTAWNIRLGARARYSQQVTFRNLRLIGSGDKNSLCGILGQNEGIHSIRYENLHIEGFPTGIDVRESGDHTILGGYFNNIRNIVSPTAMERGRDVSIEGEVRFGTLGPEVLQGQKQIDIYLEAQFKPMLEGSAGYRDPNILFVPNRILYKGKQLYFLEQATDYIPLRIEVAPVDAKRNGTARGSVPDDLLGKTNQELWSQYGLAIGGTLTPANTTTDARIYGRIGAPTIYSPELRLPEVHSSQLQGFRLICYGTGKTKIAESDPVDLHTGWNLVTSTVQGSKRSFLIFGGDRPSYTKKGK
jgi:hypothetical protein